MKIFIQVLGCRTNLYEGDFLAGELEARGAAVSKDIKGADGALIVSCSVTQEADRKCRQIIRRARRALGENGILAVCGCWAQGVSVETARELGINILTGNKHKKILPDVILEQIKNGAAFQDLRDLNLRENIINDKDAWEELSLKHRPLMHTRAFIKIQDGCDHFCSYCIIPFLRGRPVSRPLNNIIDEIKRVVDDGCKEIILTGIHLGMYGRDINSSLSEVIKVISKNKISGLERLRMGSLEPFSLNLELIKTLADCEIFCPHLHLPLQSGDDNILSLMRRGYTGGEFKNICDTARKYFSDELYISSDILVGFPGESDEAFNNTLKLMRDAGLGRVHVFPYSPRRGTLAERIYKDKEIPDNIKTKRAAEAIKLGRELLKNYAKNFIGRDVYILVEEVKEIKKEIKKIIAGHTPQFLEAEAEIINADGIEFKNIKNKIVKVKIKSVKDDGGLKGIYDYRL